MPDSKRFLLAITMGDPAGIGAEIILKAANKPEWEKYCHPVVIGDRRILERALQWEAYKNLKVAISDYNPQSLFKRNRINLVHLGVADPGECKVGKLSLSSGKAAVRFVEHACQMAMKGEVAGIVTAPLNKEAMHLAGYAFAGHTELLKELTNAKNVKMMLVGKNLRVVHNSTHLALSEAIRLVTKDNVLNTIRFAQKGCLSLGITNPRIAVAGLNPHAGESGLFGHEEQEHIIPALQVARAEGLNVFGPLPPDTAFLRASKSEFDIVVAMYHDQGHIPIKMLDFVGGVNITFGLPIIRTSVDHGTAFNIAGKGIASEKSLLMAIKLASLLVKNRELVHWG